MNIIQRKDSMMKFSVLAYFEGLMRRRRQGRYYHDEAFTSRITLIRYIRNEYYSLPDIAEFSSLKVNR